MEEITAVVFFLDADGQADHAMFQGADVLGRALKYAEMLRRTGYRFVTMVTENSMSVGKPGVDVTDDSYNWKKRRP